MKPLVLAALFVAAVLAIATLGPRDVPRMITIEAPATTGSASQHDPAPCPKGTLPDDGVCIPVPNLTEPATAASAERPPP